MARGQSIEERTAHIGQELLHDFWTVVDGEDDILDTSSNEGLDLMNDHGLVTEFDQGLRESESLALQEQMNWLVLPICYKEREGSSQSEI